MEVGHLISQPNVEAHGGKGHSHSDSQGGRGAGLSSKAHIKASRARGYNHTNDSNLLELIQASRGGEEPNRFPRPPVMRRVDEDQEANHMDFETVTPYVSLSI